MPEQLKVGPEGELSLTGVASPVANAGPTETFLARITPEGNLDGMTGTRTTRVR